MIWPSEHSNHHFHFLSCSIFSFSDWNVIYVYHNLVVWLQYCYFVFVVCYCCLCWSLRRMLDTTASKTGGVAEVVSFIHGGETRDQCLLLCWWCGGSHFANPTTGFAFLWYREAFTGEQWSSGVFKQQPNQSFWSFEVKFALFVHTRRNWIWIDPNISFPMAKKNAELKNNIESKHQLRALTFLQRRFQKRMPLMPSNSFMNVCGFDDIMFYRITSLNIAPRKYFPFRILWKNALISNGDFYTHC